MITETIATGTIPVPELTSSYGCVVEIDSTNNLALVLENTCEGDVTYPVFNQNDRFVLDYNQAYVHEKVAEFACGKAKIKTTFLARNFQLSYTIERIHDFCKDYIKSKAQGGVTFNAYCGYYVTINNPANCTISVKRNGSSLQPNQLVTVGDVLTVTAVASSGNAVKAIVFNGNEYANGTSITITHEDMTSQNINVTAIVSATVEKEFLTVPRVMQHGENLTFQGFDSSRPTRISMGNASIRVAKSDGSDWWEDTLYMTGSGNHYYGSNTFADNDLGVNLWIRNNGLYLEGWVESGYADFVVESVSLPIYSIKQTVPADEV